MSAEEAVVLGFDAALQTNIVFLSRTIGKERVEKARALIGTCPACYSACRCREDDAAEAACQLRDIMQNARP